jgi:glycosyltransferase involved in cell wall biosynthesis
MAPLVSIVVPVFNGMPHLTALVDSLFAQDYPNLEIVLSEGDGTDGSWAYLNSLSDPRVRIIRQPPGTSAAANWTAATLAARGAYTKLICQDDLLYSSAIREQVEDLDRHPRAVMAIAARDIIDARGEILYSRRGLAGLRGSVLKGDEVVRTCYLHGTNVIGEPLAVLFRTPDLVAAMPWDDTNPLMLDLSTYAKVAPAGEVVIRRQSVGAFRVSAASWSTRIASRQLAQTRAWQQEYTRSSPRPLSRADRARAVVGRHVQITLRRAAYTSLRLRGAMGGAPPPTMQR